MRTLLSIVIFTCIPIYAICQIHNYGVTLIINEGSTIYNKGSYNNKSSGGADGALDVDGKMVVIGDWINNAANNALINVDAVGTITMAGTTMQTISGANATTFETLEINNSTGGAAVKLDTNINVYDSLIITDGNIDLNGNNINLGNLGLLSGENNNNRIYGTAGEVIASRDLIANTVYTGIAGLDIDITTDATAPGATQIKRSHADMELNVSTNRSILRNFEITPTINTGLNATLRINYFDNEINSLNENDFIFYKSPTGANPWTEKTNSVVNLSGNYVEETGLNDFSKWTIGQKSVSLPIELLFFNAFAESSSLVKTEWSTATEINNDYFAIERSLSPSGGGAGGGLAFEQIGTVKGAGNSSLTLHYTFYDEHPYTGLSYYRLRQVDYDGQYEYSQMRSVYIGSLNIVSIYPNPVIDKMDLIIGAESDMEVSIAIIGVLGQSAGGYKVQVIKGHTTLSVNVSHLAAGSYVVKATTPAGEYVMRNFVIK